jgi:hypothetical protein
LTVTSCRIGTDLKKFVLFVEGMIKGIPPGKKKEKEKEKEKE